MYIKIEDIFFSFYVFNIFILAELLAKADISHKVDTSSTAIGRRYARSDELGIPFAIAIDFDTLQQPHSIVLREINSMKQVRINVRQNCFFFCSSTKKKLLFFN